MALFNKNSRDLKSVIERLDKATEELRKVNENLERLRFTLLARL